MKVKSESEVAQSCLTLSNPIQLLSWICSIIFRDMYVLTSVAYQILFFSGWRAESRECFVSIGCIWNNHSVHNSPHGPVQSPGSYGAFRSKHSKLWLEPLVQLSSPCLNFGHWPQVWSSWVRGWHGMLLLRLLLDDPGIILRLLTQCPGIFSLLSWLILSPTWLSCCFRGKESACQCRRHEFDPWVRKIPWRREWQLPLVFLLENPVGRGAWQAAAHGVVKSRIGLSD